MTGDGNDCFRFYIVFYQQKKDNLNWYKRLTRPNAGIDMIVLKLETCISKETAVN